MALLFPNTEPSYHMKLSVSWSHAHARLFFNLRHTLTTFLFVKSLIIINKIKGNLTFQGIRTKLAMQNISKKRKEGLKLERDIYPYFYVLSLYVKENYL